MIDSIGAAIFPPKGRIALSIALVTRNRPESLRRALISWRRQRVQPFEIVVSDDSDAEFAERVEAISLEHGCRYVDGPRRGLYANRNSAALACAGSHVLSADDDHEHPPDFLERVLHAIVEEPATVWCIGEFASWSEFQAGAPFYLPGQLSPHGTLRPVSRDRDAECWAISDGATVYPSEVFRRGFRFYEAVRFGASYCEFGCLLHRYGWRIRPLLSTAVIHHQREASRSFSDPVAETAASLFAALMFSFYYQRRLGNQLISASKIPIIAVRRPGTALATIRLALAYVRERRRQLRLLPPSPQARSG